MLYNWKQKIEEERQGVVISENEREELKRLQRKQRSCAWKGDIKKASAFFAKENEVKFRFIKRAICDLSSNAIVSLHGSQQISLYDWPNLLGKVISAEELHLNRRAKALFFHSRESFGSRELMKKLREEGFDVGRNRVISLMHRLNLRVKQRVAYKVTTKRKHSDEVADNLLNQISTQRALIKLWAGDVTYLRTGEGWQYHNHRDGFIFPADCRLGGGKRMTTDLAVAAMQKAISLRQPPRGLVFHSDRGSQYTSKEFKTFLAGMGSDHQ